MPKTRSLRRLSRGFAAMLSLLALASCEPNEPLPLRVGINAWPAYEFIYLAEQKGYYKDAGLEVRLVEFSSLADARRAYERGQIDVIATTVVEVLQIRDQSERRPRIVRVIDYSDGADVILASPRIRSGADLRGARVGVELASLGVYMLARGLEKYGLTIPEVTTLSGNQLSMEGQFARGELDAVVTYPPSSVKMMTDSSSHVIFSSADIPGEILDVLAVEESLLESRPGDIREFLAAVSRAMAFTEQSPGEAHPIMAAREGLTPEQFATALTDGMRLVDAEHQQEYFGPEGRLSAVIDRTARVLRETQQLSAAPVAGHDLVHDGFITPVKVR